MKNMGSNFSDIGRKEAGQVGEKIAADYLKKKGYLILQMNFRKPWGEIDIIAEKAGTIRFVEVKTVSRESIEGVSRENNDYRPEEQVHPWKLKKIARTAEMYMNGENDQRDYQISDRDKRCCPYRAPRLLQSIEAGHICHAESEHANESRKREQAKPSRQDIEPDPPNQGVRLA